MSAPSVHHRYTLDEYLTLEEASNVKHEFFNGEIYAMAGGTPDHAALAMNLGAALIAATKGLPCRVFSSDLRVRVLATGLLTYPDVTVVCGGLQRDPDSRTTVINPLVLVEITSDSTEAYDRDEKREHYQRIPSLQEYVLVSHRHQAVEVWRRDAEGSWHSFPASAGGTFRLESLSCELAVADVYAGSVALDDALP